jgi:choline dehydrogenase-like flavoprotein
VERSDIFSDAEWDELYKKAEDYIGTHTNVLDDSIRQGLVLQILRDSYTQRNASPLPLAAKISDHNSDFIVWSSSSTILHPIKDEKDVERRPLFELRSQCMCEKLKIDEKTGEVESASLRFFRSNKTKEIKAKYFIICGGPILTPQLLYTSGFRTKDKKTSEDPKKPENAPSRFILPALVKSSLLLPIPPPTPRGNPTCRKASG